MTSPGAYLTANVRRWNNRRPATQQLCEVIRHPYKYGVAMKDIDKLYENWQFISNNHNRMTNGGVDYLHEQVWVGSNNSGGTAATTILKYVAVSESTYTPAAGDITLSSEITDTNGLARVAAGTISHTPGTNTSSIQNTFTASGTYTAVQLGALFTASSGGTMANEATFSSTNLVSGDQLQLTWTITAGTG